jgi:hypothetical protein
MRNLAALFGAVLVALGTIAGCPAPHQLGLVDQLVADPTHINSVTVTRDSEEVDFYHPTTVDINGQTGDVHIVGGDGGGPSVTVNVPGGGNANANSNGNSNGSGQGQPEPASVIKITAVRMISDPPDGQNWYTGDLVVFEVTTDRDGEIHFMPPDARIAGDYTTKDGKVQISYRFVSPVGTDREPGLIYFWPQDRNTEVVSLSIVVRRRVAH